MTLRLGKLPDRTPVKLSLNIDPELHALLTDYAAIYEKTYGKKEKVEDLAPFMLDGFLSGDTAFKRARKELLQNQTKE